MKLSLYLVVLLLLAFTCFNSCTATLINVFNKKVDPIKSDSKPITHEVWEGLLKKHVAINGKLDYNAIQKDSILLNQYLDLLSTNHPNDKNWSRAESIAYWINAYNAFTVKLIVDHYPIKSIKDIKGGLIFVNTIWDEEFIQIEGHRYALNHIEHGILRKYYEEYRIHFAVNCASESCPNLTRFAFDGSKLDEQLDMVARAFLADQSKNVITVNELKLSKLFKWYKPDFTKGKTIQEYIREYTDIEISPKAKISYLDYDWTLNDVE